MRVAEAKVRKFLNKKISQLNDIVADLDSLVTEIGNEFYRVCIFGSARIEPESDDYRRVYELAFALAGDGIDIVTGGGPGLMEAANRGAKDGGQKTRSIGLHIELPFEADANPHLDKQYMHRRFSSRLDEFMRISNAVVITPGGIGTLLELFYTWQLIQVKHIEPRPLILLGKDMWSGLKEWIETQPLDRKLMSPGDMEGLVIVDTVQEVKDHLAPNINAFRNRAQASETGGK